MSTLTKPNILVVDDNPFNRELISEIAQEVGYSVIEAKNGKEALLNIGQVDFNLIILDLLMPGMDGFETAKNIREMGLTVPIVAASALALKQDRQRSLRAGCNYFLSKPLDNDKLREILEKYVKSTPREQQPTLPAVYEEPFVTLPVKFKGLHLVLVEENEQLREKFADFLNQAGFQVERVANGSDAINFIEDPTNIIDIVISNIFTSGIDGLGLLTIVKRKFADVLVFLYTQAYDTSTFQYAVNQKVDGIIPQKQFDTTALEIIDTALSQFKLKGSRIDESKTAELVRRAQDQLNHSSCIHLCPCADFAYQSLHEAGGDMLRCHRFGLDGQCGIVLADVAGHDVTASYASATFTGVLSSIWDSNKDPMDLLKKTNKELLKVGNTKSHICATAVLWDRRSGNLQIACAGNPGGLIVYIDPDDKLVYKSLKGGGMVLGALKDDRLFISESENLEENSYLFLFSDGIEEQDLINAIEVRADLFFRPGIKKICQRLIDTILEKKEQEDDMILLCINNPLKSEKPDYYSEFLSTYEEVDRACIWLEQKLDDKAIPGGNDKDIILLAAREAFLNAVEHGNDHIATAHFEVNLFLNEQELKITVLDEGSGFDYKNNVCEPTDLTLTQIGQRGLSFMASVSHKIIVDEGKVSLIFMKQ